jgi:hypothetical protein
MMALPIAALLSPQRFCARETSAMAGDQDLRQAIALIEAGNADAGRDLLLRFVRDNPNSEIAWLWLATVAIDTSRKRMALQRVLMINPGSMQAQQALDELEGRRPPVANPVAPRMEQITAATVTPPARKKWYMSPVVKVLTFIFLTPLWSLIVLDDPDSTGGVKLLAVLVLIGYILFICVPICASLS